MVVSLESLLIVLMFYDCLCVMYSSYFLFFSSGMVFATILPASVVESFKGLLAKCFSYASYILCDSLVRPRMNWALHSLGICFLVAIHNNSTNLS